MEEVLPCFGASWGGRWDAFCLGEGVRAVLLRAFLGALGLMLQAVTTYFCGQGRISAKKLCCVTAFLAQKSIMWTSSVCMLFLVPDLLSMHTPCVDLRSCT